MYVDVSMIYVRCLLLLRYFILFGLWNKGPFLSFIIFSVCNSREKIYDNFFSKKSQISHTGASQRNGGKKYYLSNKDLVKSTVGVPFLR